jgi:hypothetical protein
MPWVRRGPGRKCGWEDTDCLADDFMQSITEGPTPPPLSVWLLDTLAVRNRAADIYADMVRHSRNGTEKGKPLTLVEEREFRKLARRSAAVNAIDQVCALLGVKLTDLAQ